MGTENIGFSDPLLPTTVSSAQQACPTWLLQQLGTACSKRLVHYVAPSGATEIAPSPGGISEVHYVVVVVD